MQILLKDDTNVQLMLPCCVSPLLLLFLPRSSSILLAKSRARTFSPRKSANQPGVLFLIPTWNTYLFFASLILVFLLLLRVSNVLVFVCECVCVSAVACVSVFVCFSYCFDAHRFFSLFFLLTG